MDRKMVMRQTAVVDKAGRLSLPSDVRRRLNLQPGSRLQVEVVAEHIELTPQIEAPTLVRKGQRVVLGASGARVDAAAAVRAERDGRAERGDRGDLRDVRKVREVSKGGPRR
jgi:AbrB family looped-hinge helix DNA binding protein